MKKNLMFWILILVSQSFSAPSCPLLSKELYQTYFQEEKILTCQLLEGGAGYDKIVKVKDSQGVVVIRIFNTKRSLQTRRLICQAMEKIGKEKIGPKVLWISPHYSSIVMEFIEGRPLSPEDIKDPLKFNTLLSLIKKAHIKLKPFRGFGRCISMKMRTQKRLREIKKILTVLPPFLLEFERYLKELTIDLKSLTLIHSDLKGSNIYLGKDGKLYLLDWGEIVLGNVFDDLGGLSFYFNLTSKQEKVLLNFYFDHTPTLEEYAQLKTHKFLVSLHYALWRLRERLESLPLTTLQDMKKELKESMEEYQDPK